MVSVDNTRIRPCGLAAIAAVAVFMALAVTGSLPVGVAAPPTAAPAEASTAAGTAASAQGHMMALGKSGSDDGGIRDHGFVRDDNDAFTTIVCRRRRLVHRRLRHRQPRPDRGRLRR